MGMAQDLLAADMRYREAINNGVPPDVAKSMAYGQSYAESETRNPNDPWASYRGWQDEARAAGNPLTREVPLTRQLDNLDAARQQNLPTYESHTPGDDDDFGFRRLPSGQYLPRNYTPSSYQPGGNQMPGMPWDDPTSGAPGQMSPQDYARLMQILAARGPGGMQPGSAAMQQIGGQAGAAPGMLNLMNPLGGQQQGIDPRIMQLIQYYLAQRSGGGVGSMGAGSYPQGGGGGIDLVQQPFRYPVL